MKQVCLLKWTLYAASYWNYVNVKEGVLATFPKVQHPDEMKTRFMIGSFELLCRAK
jgi:hypothetical protein